VGQVLTDICVEYCGNGKKSFDRRRRVAILLRFNGSEVGVSSQMKCYMATKDNVEQRWVLVDAEGQTLGRMASGIASILMGKTKPVYTAHVDTGDYVIVVNAKKVKIGGNKAQTKEYQRYTGYPGGQRTISYAEMMAKKPQRVVELAVRRMLPKSTLGAAMFKKLKVYAGPEHDHAAQQPVKIEI